MTDVAAGTAEYWDQRYAAVGDAGVSWFQAEPTTSLELIGRIAGPGASLVDVGGGASRLVDNLLALGFRDLTVVDLSQEALRVSRDRVGEAPVSWIAQDVRDWQPARTFDVWHDRAAYHFLTDEADQQHYWRLAHDSVVAGGHVIVATFGEDGPESCSGLAVSRYGAAGLGRAMGAGFEVLDSLREEHVTPAGTAQSFQWVLARRI